MKGFNMSDSVKPLPFEETNYEEHLCGFCSWIKLPVTAGHNGPEMCEGRFCLEAYEKYVEYFNKELKGE